MSCVSVTQLACYIKNRLEPYCSKIEIAGSIRRGDKNPRDIDIVLVPLNAKKIDENIEAIGTKIRWGPKIKTIDVDGIKIDFFFTEDRYWGGTLFAYTGPDGWIIGLRRHLAPKLGYKMNQYGVWDAITNEFIAGETEEDIFKALKKEYEPPEIRG